jgi:hypothetical protein
MIFILFFILFFFFVSYLFISPYFSTKLNINRQHFTRNTTVTPARASGPDFTLHDETEETDEESDYSDSVDTKP